jgi:hypothetical protein
VYQEYNEGVVRLFRGLALLSLLGPVAACEGVLGEGEVDAGCRAAAQLDCERACDNAPALAMCTTSTAAPVDRDDCLRECRAAQIEAGNRAAVYGCLQDHRGDCPRTIGCARTCQVFSSGVCDPATRRPCTDDEVCDARSKMCIAIPRCMDDGDCSDGYSCLPYSGGLACYRGCSDGSGLPEDAFCQVTHACDPNTFECVPWPCITTAAALDCDLACAKFAAACMTTCGPTVCQALPTCKTDCEAARSAGERRRIAEMGCLQLGHSCKGFAACEAICTAGLPDGGAPFDGAAGD